MLPQDSFELELFAHIEPDERQSLILLLCDRLQSKNSFDRPTREIIHKCDIEPGSVQECKHEMGPDESTAAGHEHLPYLALEASPLKRGCNRWDNTTSVFDKCTAWRPSKENGKEAKEQTKQ